MWRVFGIPSGGSCTGIHHHSHRPCCKKATGQTKGGAMKLMPLRDKIIVKPEKRIQSVLYVQTAEADSVGYVVAVGPDAAKHLNVGDKVYFGTLAKDYGDEYLKFEEININDQRHLKMSWQDICFVEES
jgi:co-chaperonin GroES (HSP10)